MDKALIISGAETAIKYLYSQLIPFKFEKISVARSGNEARRILNESEFDLIVINAPLKDEFGHEIATSICETSVSSVIMIVQNEIVDEISSRFEKYGIYCLSKPMNNAVFSQTMHLIATSQIRISELNQQIYALQEKINDLQIINKAKCYLIEHLKISEAEAHRKIEVMAMNNQITRLAIAKSILRKLEE